MPQAVLTTQRLVLVPLGEKHLPMELELVSDPEVMRYLTPRGQTAEEAERSFWGRLELGRRVDGLGSWAGSCEGELVGIWMLQPPHGPSQLPVPGEADLGYRVLRRHWRHGLAREGALELIRHGFEDLGLVRIFAQTMAVNTPSRATMSSVGMRFVRGFHEEHEEPVAGHEHGEVEYELRRADWLATRSATP